MYCSLIILLLLVSQAEVTFQINPLDVTLHPQRMFLVLDNASAGRWSLVSCSCCCLLTMFCSGGGSKGVFLPPGLHSPAAGGMPRSPVSEEPGRGHHHCSWLWNLEAPRPGCARPTLTMSVSGDRDTLADQRQYLFRDTENRSRLKYVIHHKTSLIAPQT